MDKSEAFLQDYESHADGIFRFCLFKVSSRELARDLTQEVFLRAWDYAVSGKHVSSYKALFYKIASNLVIDYYRKRKESSLDELMEGGFDPGDGSHHERFGNLVDAQQVMQLLERLDQPYRDILILRFVEDMAVKDIAKLYGEKENNISVKIYRGLNELRSFIKK